MSQGMMSQMRLCDFVFKVDMPCVFINILERDGATSNSSCDWKLDKQLADVFGSQSFLFRIGDKSSSTSR